MHGRLHSFRSRALLACVPVLALVAMASVGTAQAAHTPANSRAAVRAEIQRLLRGFHPTNHGLSVHSVRGVNLKQVGSTNWSGYADTGSGFSSVSGKWTEPKISNCSTSGAVKAAAFWVGIDGFSSATVEQGGTLAICGGGTPLTYLTWWEMYPTNPIQAVGETVKPGDKISASVVRSGTKYTIKVTDSTTSGNSFSTTQSCSPASACKNSSAEWIGERPSTSSGPVPLPKFSTWTVSSAAVKAGSKSGTIKTFTDNEITMFNKAGGHVLAKPGALNSAGNSFTDTWKASS